jgi:copper chaperone NosL
MLISSARDAGQTRAAGQETRFYDDIGCLAADRAAASAGSVSYVHLATGEWATAESAWFAIEPEHETPMNYGVVAYATHNEAERRDREHRVRRWTFIKTYVDHK